MGGSAQFVFAARRSSPSIWKRITKDPVLGPLVEARAIEPQTEPRRVYPRGGLAAQVVGVDGAGLSGVELTRNDELSARDGQARSRRSTTGRPATPTGRACCTCASRCRARRCSSRSTTRIQSLVQKEIAKTLKDWHAKAVTAVVLDTRTGGILAMASAPGVPPQGYRAGNRDEWRLRAITDLYEPGSTFKLVTFMAALQEGVITPDTPFPVPDKYTKTFENPLRRARSRTPTRTRSRTGRRARSSRTPRTSARSRSPSRTPAASRSCSKWIDKLGFGEPTGVDLPGEVRALLLDNDKWYGTGILNVPIGEGIAVDAAADGGALRLDRERRDVAPAARHGRDRRRSRRPAGRRSQLVSKHVAAAVARHADAGRRRRRHRHPGAHQGLQRRRQDRHDAEVRREARHLLRSVQAQVPVPDVVRRLRARQEPALRRARDGRRAARQERRHLAARGRHRRGADVQATSPRASCRSCASAPTARASSASSSN